MKDILHMDKVTKSFGKGRTEVQALKGIDLRVQAGEFISIIGPSGSGKSTFLTIAGGLQSSTTGTTKINTIDFNKLSEKERSKVRFKEVGFILQASNLIPYLTVKEQLKLVDKINKKNINRGKIDEMLDSLDILELQDKYLGNSLVVNVNVLQSHVHSIMIQV